MPTRFPTEAANDPGDNRSQPDQPASTGAEGESSRRGADGTPGPHPRGGDANGQRGPVSGDNQPAGDKP